MERKLATIERIAEIHPIDGADAIERAVIRGWNVVIKKGDFKEGDLCVYCEIDSLMPEREEFEFLRPRGFRIRTIKLRGQVSQGIIFPLTVLPDKLFPLTEFNIGEDVSEVLGITKYEPPIPACLAGVMKGGFPSHSIKTDEERIQNLMDHFEDYKKETWIATEKLDGSSATFSIFDGVFGVSSRNLELKENEENSFWKFARDENVEVKMRKYMADHGMEALTIQGELIGEGIQKNIYRIKGQTVRFFRVFDPIKYQFLPYELALEAIKEMWLETVPVIDMNFKLPEKYEDLIAYSDGRSAIAETAREGVVFVAKNPSYNDNGRLSFKVISNKFILKHDA